MLRKGLSTGPRRDEQYNTALCSQISFENTVLKPTSLLGISLELIGEVARPGPYPADARVGRFFRSKRFLGSRDRRFISAAVYSWLRFHDRARPRWKSWLKLRNLPALEAGSGPGSFLLDILAMAQDGNFPWEFNPACKAVLEWGELDDNSLDKQVRQAATDSFLDDQCWPENPEERFAAEVSMPPWLGRLIRNQMGEEDGRDFAGHLCAPASVDLRVNSRRADRKKVMRGLQRETEAGVELSKYSPTGLRLDRRINLTATTASRKSWVEVQDEGSQIAVFCTDAAPGMTVIDACAGSGGKTLGLADIILAKEDEGEVPAHLQSRLIVCEIEGRKLQELRRRTREARLGDQVEYVLIGEKGDLSRSLSPAHLVLVDSPCTGLGTLRRNPEAKNRYGPEDVERFQSLQLEILERFAGLVRPRGRLVYVTCSFLDAECDEVVELFEKKHPEFSPSPSFWASKRLPAVCLDGHKIRLGPSTTGSDAFFIASWQLEKPPAHA